MSNCPTYRTQNFTTYAGLKSREQDRVKIWCDIFEQIHTAPVRAVAVEEMFSKYGHIRGFSKPNIDRLYDEWRHSGMDWRVAIRQSAVQRAAKPADLFAEVYKRYCEDAHQSSRECWRRMMRDLAAGKKLPPTELEWKDVFRVERPGCKLPDACPYSPSNPPRGCQYRRLQDYFGLTKFEANATRIGLAAARPHLLPVLTTRVGLGVGRVYMFDDMKHNVKTNYPGNSQGQTPLEFAAMDVYSGSRFAYLMRPVIESLKANGNVTRDSLKEFEFRCVVAKTFVETGYHPQGTICIGEHGTAVFRDWLRKLLSDLSDGLITFADSAILDKQVHRGMFPGQSKGNFHIKSCLESSHHLFQTVTSNLPAQVGRNSRIDKPEQLTGLDAYNEKLLKLAGSELMKRDPERCAMLIYPALDYNQYVRLVYELYDILEDRDWHDLEGFEEEGLTVTEYRLANTSTDWHNMNELLAMTPQQAGAIHAFVSSDIATLTRTRKLAPREVFQRGKGQLVKLSKWHIPEILGRDSGIQNMHVESNGLIEFADRYFGPGKHIYYGTITTPAGFQEALSLKRKYIIHLNPLALDQAFIRDQESDQIVGISQRYNRACKTDLDAIHVLMGKQNHDLAVKSHAIAVRHADQAAEREAVKTFNDAVADGTEATPTDIFRRERNAAQPDVEEEVFATKKTGDDHEFGADEIYDFLRN